MNILVADDHPMVREALAQVVARIEPGAALHLASDFPSALRLASQQPLDLALIDWQMPGLQPLDGLRRMRELCPALPVLVVTGHADPHTAKAALDAGACAFVPKTADAEVLMQAVQSALSGQPLPASLAPVLVAPAGDPDDARARGPRLTARQREVLRLLCDGQPNRAIGAQLGLTEGTVKLHIAAILRTLRVRNRTEAALRARRDGLLDDEVMP